MPVLIAVAAAGLAVLALATWNVVARQIAPPHKPRGVVQSGELPCCKQLNELYCKNQPKPCQGMNTEIPELMPASAIEETNQNCCRAYEKITHPR